MQDYRLENVRDSRGRIRTIPVCRGEWFCFADGTPWYMRPEQKTQGEKVRLFKAEARAAIWGALKATLLIVAIFAGAFALFILLCSNIWFK